MNGGVLHPVEFHTDDELQLGRAGFRHFGLASAAEALEWVAGRLASIDPDSDLDAAEELEVEAAHRYAEIVPSDSVLVERFAGVFKVRPDRFAPLPP